VEVDSDGMSAEEVIDRVVELLHERLEGRA